jgi:hypothetical protein
LKTKKKRKTIADRALVPAIPSAPDRFEWQAAVVGLTILIAYANSLTSGFHFDDSAIFANPWIMGSGFGLDLFRLDQTRPLTYLTFHWNYLVNGQAPALYHLVNLLLHAANAILVLAIARKYVSPFPAVCVALVFALHPLQTESVTYVFARSTLLSTNLALWVIWFCKRRQYLVSALLFGVSLLAKEETIALPGFLLLLELFERRRPRAGYFAALFGFASLAAGRLFYLILISPVDPGVGRVRGISTGDYALTQCRVIWIYLRLMIAPIGLNLDRDVSVSTSLFAPWSTLPAALMLALLIALLIWLTAGKRQPAALWALGFFVLLAPSSSIVAQADVTFEHRTYLPMVCAVIALGFLLERVPRPRLAAGLAVVVPLMLISTILRNQDWHDEKTFWADVVVKSPDKARGWLELARAHTDNPAIERKYLSRGLAIDPRNADLNTQYGLLLFAVDDPAGALGEFRKAMAVAGETADGWNNIGGAYFELHDSEASLSSFRKALGLDPCGFNARRNMMMIYSQRGDPHRAWLAGEVPATCAMLPESARELETLRRRAGTP